jgi:hypothetical protein
MIVARRADGRSRDGSKAVIGEFVKVSEIQLASEPDLTSRSKANPDDGTENQARPVTETYALAMDDDDWAVIEKEDGPAEGQRHESAKECFISLELDKIISVIAKGAKADTVAAANSTSVSILLTEVCQYFRTVLLEVKLRKVRVLRYWRKIRRSSSGSEHVADRVERRRLMFV